MSYDTFLLYIIVLPEYVESTQILPKDSPMATIWLHFFLQNKNCSQEIVESLFRVRVDYCYSKYMLNFVAGLQSDLSPFLATILDSLGYKYSQFGYTKSKRQ